MLNGACRNLLALLPSDIRQQFDRELCQILSSNGTGQNSMLLLWCFGIVVLAEHPDKFSDLEAIETDNTKSSPSLDRPWTTASGRKLFGSLNGIYKTLNLTYLSVIWATKGDVGVSNTEAIEGIQIAVRTLRLVDIEVRASWPNSSALAKNIFPKLPAKILREGICPMVQVEALCFYGLIAGANKLPMDIVSQYQRCLSSVEGLTGTDSLHDILSMSLPIFAPQMQDDLLQPLLANMLETCVSKPDPRPLDNLVVLIDALAASSISCAALSSKLLQALMPSATQERIWILVRTDTTVSSGGCRTYISALHREANAAMVALVLNLIVIARPNGTNFPNALASALIMKQRGLPYIPRNCSHAMTVPSNPSVSLFQQESTPFTGQHLHNWRTRLRYELESQNSYQLDSVVRSVAQICQDLESRCNTVEEPLRQEKARSQELEQLVEELTEQVSSLESQAADARFHLDGLEDEKLSLADERDRVSARLDELRLRFEEANRDAGDALRMAREELDAKELESRSTILSREEELRDRDTKIRDLSHTVSEVKTSLEHTEEELRAFGERYEDLQARFDSTSRQLDEERDAKFRQSEDILKLKERNISLEHQLQTTEQDLEAISGQLSDLQVTHQELKQSSEDALREAKVQYTTDLDVAASKAEEQYSELDNKLTETMQMYHQLGEQHTNVRGELQALQETYSALEVRMQELDTLCGEQEEELEELRTLRRNVLASMGLGTGSSLAIRSASRSQRDDPVPETPREPIRETREHRRRKSPIHTQDFKSKMDTISQGCASTENVTEVSFTPTEHHSQNGSTPKRQKPRPSFKVPTMQTPFSQRPTLASRSTSRKLSPVKRSALRQMSPNRRHTTVGFALSETEEQEQIPQLGSTRKRRGSHCEPSQDDFDMDDFLAGTPFTPGAFASGTGRLPEEDEVTTTEL
ncbi:hypothetical protein E8E13_005156 [Curvularia kusanoi]|uniref:Uncharacterized protein n=1 Tax=Curvularia kusanoi TaxID=90978 RepID=A0A9P4T8M6_CURKU|nr:hypothetical protein E8E13_005156 [Curvularia kusanoi]